MLLKSRTNCHPQQARKLPLRLVLIVPFVLQISTAVGLVWYLSFKNGQQAVNDLAQQLMGKASNLVEQHLDTYLATPHEINQINADAIELGLLNPRDLSAAGHYFWKQIQVFNVGYIACTLVTGEYAAAGYDNADPNNAAIDEISPSTQGKNYTYETDSQGNRTRVAAVYDDYDPRKEDWYSRSLQVGKPVWSKVYSWDDFPDILAISAGYPIYSQKNTPIGVLNVDLRLSQISQFLRQLKMGASSKIFILERNGLLVGSSSTEKPYTIVKGKAQRLNALDSTAPLIEATARHLTEHFGNLNEIKASQPVDFTLDNQRHFVHVTPWQDKFGLDWLIIITVPESDFMAQINANNRITILLCLVALGIATVFGIYTSRWITRPILRLNTASQAIASGNLDQTVEVKGIKELGILAQSFNQMAGQLRESFTILEKTNEELEQRVEERTAQLKSAKEAADTANHAKSEFLANMSHELRTPLNGILGYAQILQRDQSANPKQQDGLSIIHQCGNHLLTLINDVLDIAKIEAQKLELYPTELEFEKFLLGVWEICRIKAEQKEIDFSYQFLNRLPQAIRADEKRLRQVLINLLGNAIKFTDRGEVTFKVGVVTNSPEFPQPCNIQLQTTGGRRGEPVLHKIRFQIEDTGIGMTPTQLEKIFLPFEQVGTHFCKAEGAGLGLTISRQIVEMMGGEIKVESTYGVGSKFWFDLDLPEATGWIDLKLTQFDQRVIGYQGKQRTILIVDDRWENRSVIVELLELISFKVIEAENGQEGLDKAREFQPDLIITDLAMPVMSGFEMTKQLRQTEAFKDARIIASSASVFSFDRQRSREAGCDDFLPKPVQTSELLDQLQNYLGLEWIYETNAAPIPRNQDTTQLEAMVIPPGEELIALYKAAKAGYVLEIQAEANRLKQLDLKYTNFANQVLRLASEFEDEAITQLIEPYVIPF